MLLCAKTIFLDVRFEIEPDIRAVDYDAEDSSNDDAGEDYTLLAEVEAVSTDVDEREGFEVGVVDPVDEGGVEVGEENCWVLDADLCWNEEGIVDDFIDGFLSLV